MVIFLNQDILKNFPKLLRGSEEQFKMLLLKEDSPCCEKLLQMLANAGPYINIEIRYIYNPYCASI